MGTPKSSTIQRWQILNILTVADNLPHRQDASRPRTGAGGSRSAIFLSPGATYHADRCEPLRQAVARGEVRLKTFARRGYPGKPLPPRMLPEISTVGFWDATGPQGWGLDWHRNEGIELTYLARGRTEFMVEKESFLLESGHLTVTRPWQEHRVGNPNVGACRLHWLILDVGVRRPDQTWRWPAWLILPPADLRRLTTLLSHNEQPVWRANAEIGGCFEKIAKLVEGAAPAAVQTRLQLYINELFLALLELLQKKNVVLDSHLASTRRSVEMFLSALPQHVAHPWTLDEMAYQCGLGASAFGAYCKQISNLSPARFLMRCRVDAARRLLDTHPDLTVTGVALACGFHSSQYLATVFRRFTGRTPREIRQPQRR